MYIVYNGSMLRTVLKKETKKLFMEDIENEIRWQETLSTPQNSPVFEEMARKALEDSKERQR